MSKAELDELNRVSKQWREGHNAPPEQLPELPPDGRDAATPPFTVGEQIELF
jgi:hypothetical protein